MAIEINLLATRNRRTITFERALLITRIGAALFAVVTISFAVIAFFLSRDTTMSQLAENQQALSAKLTPYNKKAASLLFIHNKLKNINTIISKRYVFERILIETQNQIPPDVTLQTLSLNKSQLQISIVSRSLTSIQTVTDNLTKLIKSKTLFKQMTLQGIVGDEKAGTYSLSITLILL